MIEWRHLIDYPSSRSPTGSSVAAVLLCTRFASSFDALREVRKIPTSRVGAPVISPKADRGSSLSP